MPKLSGAALVFFLLCCFICGARSQTSPTLAGQPGNLKTIVVSPGTSSDSVIVVPPARLQRVGFHNEKHVAGDLTAWLNKETALNGLYSPELQPWHIVVIYDQFDEDGDNVHSGVYEEFWAPKNTNGSIRVTILTRLITRLRVVCFAEAINGGPTALKSRFGRRFSPRFRSLRRSKGLA